MRGAIMIDLLLIALLGAGALAILAAPFGCFALWRGMAFFTDATAHASLLGVALGLVLGVSIPLAVLCVAMLTGLGLWFLARRGQSSDTVLAVFSYAGLAFSILITQIWPGPGIDFEAVLFGDILAISAQMAGSILIIALISSAAFYLLWKPLLMATLSPELMRAEGQNPEPFTFGLLIGTGVLVGLSLPVVGALLIGGFLILPAAAAFPFARRPGQMVVIAVLLGLLGATTGILGSVFWDLQTGPMIITALTVIFALSRFLSRPR